MKKNNTALLVTPFLILALLSSGTPLYAATSPALGAASTFGILASTFTNTLIGTTINGDVGYTTGPALAPTINGTVYVADSTYTQAGTDQGVALTLLNNEVCTHDFAPGAIDLSSNVDFPTGTYPAGVYCVTGAATIGTGGVTLTGTGTHIFRISGALNSIANATVTASGGASACSAWWIPVGATTLAANTTFLGTTIDDAGITIGSNVTWTGRALAYNGTVTTDASTITTPSCTGTLTVTKTVINDDGGEKAISDFILTVNGTAVTSGVATAFTAGSYVVREPETAGYKASDWGGDCDNDGNVTVLFGDAKTCTITNDDFVLPSYGSIIFPPTPPVITPPVVAAPVVVATPIVVNDTVVPKLPKTGLGPNNTPMIALYALFGSISVAAFYFFMKRRIIA